MLTKPMRPCKQVGCPALVPKGWCTKHQRTASASPEVMRKRADARKGEGRQFYSTPEWREVRAARLKISPFCCCGCRRRANTVDHIKPRREFPDLALDLNNTRSFYKDCHNRHTATSGGGFGNRRRASA